MSISVFDSVGGLRVGAITGSVGRNVFRSSQKPWAALPQPHDESLVHGAGPDPQKILLFGGGPVVGYGVASHDAGLGGHIARQLSAITGRGTALRVAAHPRMLARDTLPTLESAGIETYDAVVLSLGNREALELVDAERWHRDVRAVIDHVVRHGRHTLELVVLGIPSIDNMRGLAQGARISQRIEQLNEVTRKVCADRPQVRFVAFTAGWPEPERGATKATYSDWAADIVPVLARQLEGHRGSPEFRALEDADRQTAVEAIPKVAEVDRTVDLIVATARDLFGASGAALSVLNHRRVVERSTAGVSPLANGCAELCEAAITRGHFVMVDDTESSDWASETAGIVTSTVRFYAGYPIVAPTGQHVGVLSIVDSEPRRWGGADVALLRDLALHVQSALWSPAPTR
jgi:GAF domain-containing protein